MYLRASSVWGKSALYHCHRTDKYPTEKSHVCQDAPCSRGSCTLVSSLSFGGLLRRSTCGMIVVSPCSNPVWQNITSLLCSVGSDTPHSMRQRSQGSAMPVDYIPRIQEKYLKE